MFELANSSAKDSRGGRVAKAADSRSAGRRPVKGSNPFPCICRTVS